VSCAAGEGVKVESKDIPHALRKRVELPLGSLELNHNVEGLLEV
jgi:hypothetical protein